MTDGAGAERDRDASPWTDAGRETDAGRGTEPGPEPGDGDPGPDVEAGRPGGASEDVDTVQLLVEDPGNRDVISDMLCDRYDVESGTEVVDADLYLVEDRLLSRYREELSNRVARADPTFQPVVVIRRSGSGSRFEDPTEDETPLLVDEVVDAPIDRTLLVRRLRSLLVRRRQSRELTAYVSTLEDRERDLRRFERAVEATRNAVAIIGTDGTIEYVNPAFESVTGYAESAAVGRTLRLIQAEDPVEAFDETFWQTMRDRDGWEGEVVAERATGDRYVADATITTIAAGDGAVEGFIAVVRDVTERIRREQALQDRESELDLLRQVLTRYLRHNLRNGLNVIRGHAERIAETGEEGDRDSAETIVNRANQLVETSETARRYSTLIERGSDRSASDLAALARDAAAEVRERYPEVSIEVDAPETCTVLATEGIREAVVGLVENAAGHNDASDPWVRVSVRSAEGVRLTVEDNGPGIPDHDLAAFEQGEESPLTHSSGVGVWLSKWVFEGAGGQMSFDDTARGTRVTVDFPASGAERSEDLDVPDLKARERRLRTVIDRMTDAVIEVDASWEVSLLDSQAEAILDVDADAATGRDFWTVFPEARETPFWDACQEAMASRSAARVEEYYEPIDRWLVLYVYPDFGGGISVYFQDTTEQNRREAELERYETIVEALNDPVYALNEEGRFTYVNDAFTELTGYDRETAVGSSPDLIKSEEARTTGRRNLGRLLSSDGPDSAVFEIEIQPRTGDPILCEDHMGVLPYDGDEFEGSAGVLRDLSGRVERERQLRDLNERSRDLMTAETREAVAEIGVEAARDVLGLEANAVHLYDEDEGGLVPVASTDAVRELVGDPPVLPPGDSIAWRVYEDGEPFVSSDVRADPDVHNPDTEIGSELYLPLEGYGVLIAGSGSTASFDDGDVLAGEILAGNVAIALTQADRTERLRSHERDLQRQNDRLEEFSGVVSHDLRNPLNVAEGRLELARAERDDEHLAVVADALDRMNRLIDDLLTLARDGAEVGALEPVDLDDIVTDSWAAVDTPDARLRVDVDGAAPIRADRSRLRQLLENLMHNSVEHGSTSNRPEPGDSVEHGSTSSRTEPDDSVEHGSTDDESVTVTVGALPDGFYVADDGPGIPEADRETVFEAGHSTSVDGTGFGLSIVEQVADAHGWTVRIVESADGGARFEITGVAAAE